MNANALCLLTAAAFLLNCCFLFRYLAGVIIERNLWRNSKAFAALCFFIIVFVLLFHAGAGVPLRSGYDNEHCFGLLASSYAKPHNWLGIVMGKEVSPTIGFAFVDLLSGNSLEGIVSANKLLVPVCALLLGAALLELGAGFAGAIAGCGLYSLNFLALLNSHTVSTTNWNMFFVLCAVLSASRLAMGKNCLADFAWYFCSMILVLSGRFEFFPVLLLPLLPALRFVGWKGADKRVWILLALWCLCCLLWVLQLRHISPANGAINLRAIYNNVEYHLGSKNLSLLSGVSSSFWAYAALGLLAVFTAWGMWLAWKRDWSFLVPVWLVSWGLGFASIFVPLDRYPLQFIRHDLYFFLPFCLLAGLGAGLLTRRLTGWRSYACVGVTVALLAFYAKANVRTALSLNNELRTDDIEWQFLMTAKRNWPANCRATTTDTTRSLILMRYFPYAYSDESLNGQCLLFYKTVRGDIFSRAGVQIYSKGGQKSLSVFVNYDSPWLEQRFFHRFYTMWTNSDGYVFDKEEVRPIPLTLGFYPARFSAPDVDNSLVRH